MMYMYMLPIFMNRALQIRKYHPVMNFIAPSASGSLNAGMSIDIENIFGQLILKLDHYVGMKMTYFINLELSYQSIIIMYHRLRR